MATFSKCLIVGLIVLLTVGGFLEVSVDSKYRLTFGRLLLALLAPVLWILILFLPPWDHWNDWLFSSGDETLKLWVGGILLVAFVAGALRGILFFVASIVVWIGASLTGTLREEIRAMRQALSVRVLETKFFSSSSKGLGNRFDER